MKNYILIIVLLSASWSSAQHINDVMTNQREQIVGNLKVYEDTIYIVRNQNTPPQSMAKVETHILRSDLDGQMIDSTIVPGLDSFFLVHNTDIVFDEQYVFIEQILSDPSIDSNFVRIVKMGRDLEVIKDSVFYFTHGNQMYSSFVSTWESSIFSDLHIYENSLVHMQVDTFQDLHITLMNKDLKVKDRSTVHLDIVGTGVEGWSLFRDVLVKDGKAYIRTPGLAPQVILTFDLDTILNPEFLPTGPTFNYSLVPVLFMDELNSAGELEVVFKKFIQNPIDSISEIQLLRGQFGESQFSLNPLPGSFLYENRYDDFCVPFSSFATYDSVNQRISTLQAYTVEGSGGNLISEVVVFTKELYSTETERYTLGDSQYIYPYSLEHTSDGRVLLFTFEIVNRGTPFQRSRHRVYGLVPGEGAFSLILDEKAEYNHLESLLLTLASGELEFSYTNQVEDLPTGYRIWDTSGKVIEEYTDQNIYDRIPISSLYTGVYILEVTT